MLVQLLINDDAAETSEPVTRFGGRPAIPRDQQLEWPLCRACAGPMQFLGQLRVNERLLLLFMCQNDPGSCEEWDAGSGANAVVVLPAHSSESWVMLEPPITSEATIRGAVHGAQIEEIASGDYDEAREGWSAAHDGKGREVLGQLSGEPAWIQADETPSCDACATPMRFVAQLEQGPDYRTEMNFGGGGCAYVFDCSCGSPKGKFLWQCT